MLRIGQCRVNEIQFVVAYVTEWATWAGKLLVDRSVYFPTLMCGQKLLVVTGKMRMLTCLSWVITRTVKEAGWGSFGIWPGVVQGISHWAHTH